MFSFPFGPKWATWEPAAWHHLGRCREPLGGWGRPSMAGHTVHRHRCCLPVLCVRTSPEVTLRSQVTCQGLCCRNTLFGTWGHPNKDPPLPQEGLQPPWVPLLHRQWQLVGEAKRNLMTVHLVVACLRLLPECYCSHFFSFWLKGRLCK